jgi:hypothetical protein
LISNNPLSVQRKPKINTLFKDNPILDILHVANEDYVQGRFTSVSKLLSLMYKNYPQYSQPYLKKLINITIHSQWFDKSNNPDRSEVHLIERGVEVYLQMLSSRQAEEANIKANWIIALTSITILIMLIGMLLGKEV